MIFFIAIQILLLALLFVKDRNTGGKELFKRQHWKISDVVIVLLTVEAYPLYFVAVAYIFLQFNVDLRPLIHSLSEQEISLYTYIPLLAFLAVLFKLKFKENIKILGIESNKLKKHIAAGLMVAFIGFMVFDGIAIIFRPNNFEPRIIGTIKDIHTPLDYLVLFLGIVILGPMVEEIVYRGILYSPYRKKYGPIIANVIVSLMFALSHPSPEKAFGIAVLLTALYEKTESITATFIAHSCINMLVILSAFYMLS
jgi:uncharacterized protein